MTAKARISEKRERAHQLMLFLGWEGGRATNGKFWSYQRTIKDGTVESVRVRHMSFSPDWVGWVCSKYEPCLKHVIQEAKRKYIAGLIQEVLTK